MHKLPSQLSFPTRVRRDKYLLLLFLPVAVYYVVFQYVPMAGIVLAFQDFLPGRGVFGSPWVGLHWFEQFFGSVYFTRTVRNTLLINVYSLLFGFPFPILFALVLNEVRAMAFKRTVQTVSYLPHFVSTVVVVGMLVNFLSPTDGIVNTLIKNLGGKPIFFMAEPSWFRALYVGSGIWQEFGWGSIIYLAALAGIDPQLYEAARIDGAGRFQQMLHVTLPGIAPTIVILLILSIGNLLSVGFEKVILMYSPATYETADVISSYVDRRGIVGAEFSYAAAVGLFNSVVNFLLLMAANWLSKKANQTSLW